LTIQEHLPVRFSLDVLVPASAAAFENSLFGL